MLILPVLPLSALLLALTVSASPTQEGPNPPRRLRVELRDSPVAVDEARPRFSWEIDDPRRAATPSAYHVLVATSEPVLKDGKGDHWDSGKVQSTSTSGVEYAGKPLAAGRSYWWSVRTWDALGRPSAWSAPATFTAAPRGADAWQAAWIRADRAPDKSSIGHKSETVATEDAWPWISFDFGGNVRCDRVRLHPARPHGDASRPGELFPLRLRVYTDPTGRFADTKAFRIAEYEWQDVPDAGAEPFELELGRFTLRYLRIVATKVPKDGDAGYALALGEVEILDGDTNIAPGAQITVSGAATGPGWTPYALVDGALVPEVGVATEPEAEPRVRVSFTLDAPVVRAHVHAAAIGAYELTVNGRAIDGARPVTGSDNHAQRAVYQTHDLSRRLAQGENVIGVQLARRRPWPSPPADALPEEPAFFAEGEVVLANGKRVPLRTDASWRGNRSGPLLAWSARGDETRDARREAPGWDAPFATGGDWRPVVVVNDLKPALAVDREPPTRVLEVLDPASVREIAPGAFLYDFGRRVVGTVRLEATGEAGQVVRLRRAVPPFHPDTSEDGPDPIERVTLRAGQQTLEARFGLAPFRYALAEGFAADAPPPAAFALVIERDLADAGAFTCSDPDLTAIFERESAALQACWLSPTDLEGYAVVTPFALLRYDCASLLGSRLAAARAALDARPRRPEVHDDPAWAEVYVLQPWESWLHAHDIRFLRSSAARALAWIASLPEPARLAWPDPHRIGTPDERGAGNVLAAIYLAHAARIAARMALVVNDPASHAKARAVAERARSHARAGFADATRAAGRLQQRLLVAALAFELWESRDEARGWADQLARILRAGQPLVVGPDLGHRALLSLSRHGQHELALELARRPEVVALHLRAGDTVPSWWAPAPAAAGSMRWKHPTSPAIGEWMMRAIAGIELVDVYADAGPVSLLVGPDGSARSSSEGPGPWARIRLAPRVTGGITQASAEHRSIAGLVRGAWRIEGDVLEYTCTVPPGSTAELELPAKDAASIELDGKALAEDKSLIARESEPGIVRLEIPAGSYTFRSKVR